jgi:hypothetical protein
MGSAVVKTVSELILPVRCSLVIRSMITVDEPRK